MSHSTSEDYSRFKFQNELIYKNQLFGIIAMFGVIALLVFSFHGVTLSRDLYLWTGLCVASYVARYILVIFYHSASDAEQSLPKWEDRFTTSVIASGLIWGSTAFLIYPDGYQMHQAALLFIVSLMGVATAATHSGYRRASALFILCSMLPFIVRLLVEPGLLPKTMALWVLLFLLLIVGTAKNLHLSTIKVFNLTREKNRLLEQVNLRNEELSALNAELVEARDSAEAGARAKSQFLANMSHEIRTPMHGVLGMAQVLKCTRIDEHQQHYLEILQRSGETLLALLDDVLDLAKIESGEIGLHPEIVEMEKWHEDMQVLLRPLFDGSDVAFHYRIKEGMPKALLVDRTRLTQIVVNLVANAAKFTTQGEVILSISGEYLNNRDLKLKLDVKDTGIGMPGDQLDVIFNSFYQLNQSRVYDKGAGLGLAITQKIAEAMDTVLRVDSVVGKGSCFGIDIVLPIADTNSIDSEKVATDVALPALKLLVVDDDPVSRKLVSLLLKHNGHSVSTASNGKEGIERVKNGSFDAILMDVHMPVMNGEEAVAVIRADSSDQVRQIPVIGMTASVMGNEKEKYLEAGMTDVVEKPVIFDKLVQSLRKTICV